MNFLKSIWKKDGGSYINYNERNFDLRRPRWLKAGTETVDLHRKCAYTKESYINWGKHPGRPDVRDALSSRTSTETYSGSELNNTPDKPHRKCARIVGDTMGKYHRTATALSTEHSSTWHRTGNPLSDGGRPWKLRFRRRRRIDTPRHV